MLFSFEAKGQRTKAKAQSPKPYLLYLLYLPLIPPLPPYIGYVYPCKQEQQQQYEDMTRVVVDAVLLRLSELGRHLHGIGYAVTAHHARRVVDIPCQVLGEILLLVDGISLYGHEYRVTHDSRVVSGYRAVSVLRDRLRDKPLLWLAGHKQG